MVRCGLFVLLVSYLSGPSFAQEADWTRAERNVLRAINEDLDRVERLIRQRRWDQAARSYAEANQRLAAASPDMSAPLRIELEKQRARLVSARDALAQSGVAVPEPNAVPSAGGDAVSFSRQIVPLLVEKCGRCHVSAARGQFSMASYNALLASRHVEPGQPVASRLIQVIETGDMPRGGGTVADGERNLLRQWIAQGAKSDLDDNNQNLNEIARGAMPAPAEQPELMAERPTGSETVSFALDVAPILIDNCSGCHLDAQQIRGGLNVTTFAGLLRGGDNGRALAPGRGADSLLVRKLCGMADGQRMPLGRPALPTDVIDTIVKWIDEGARFDGGDPALPIRTVAARVRANAATHDQLAAERAKQAERSWATVMADRAAHSFSNNEILAIGGLDRARLEALAGTAESIAQDIKGQFKLNKADPLVKGKVTIMIFDQRYDFNEFGVMVLGHPLPREVKMVWRFDQVDARIAVCLTPDFAGETLELELARQLAALYGATVAGDMPRWFAEGLGYDAAAKMYPRADTVKSWPSAAQQAAQRSSGDDLVRGRLSEEVAALVGYSIVTRLKSDASRFNRFWAALQRTGNFAESFQSVYQTTWESMLNVSR